MTDAAMPLAVRADSLPGDVIDPEKALNVVRIDGWQNASTGIGMAGFDKRLGTRFITDIVSYRDAVELWRGDDIAARVIEALPKDSLKKGYEINIADEGDYGGLKEQVETLLDDIDFNASLELCLKFERAYGGAALLIGANDGQDMSMPLNLDNILDFKWVTPLEPIELFPLQTYADPTAPKFGKPELYQLNAIAHGPSLGMADPMSRVLPTTSVIHESRLIIFPGIRVSKFQNRTSVGGLNWGDSILTRMVRVLADFNMGYASTGIILTEQGLPIFKMKELAKLVNANKLDVIRARLSLLFQQMSTARAAVLDTEESYERQGTSLAGLPDTLDRLGTRLAAAVDMPITKLLGQSPKGLGNEGESDEDNWYDNVGTFQNQKLKHPIRKVVQVAMRACKVPEPQKWSIKFAPLHQLSEVELADARNKQATTDQIYLTTGVLSADDVRKSRFSGEYSFETTVDFDAHAAMDQATNAPLTAEDMQAMGLDPNDPNDVAIAQQMAPQPGAPAAPGAPGAPPAPGAKPNPFAKAAPGAPAAPGAKPNPFAKPGAAPAPGQPPAPGAKPNPFAKKPAPGAPAAAPAAPGQPPAKPNPFAKKPAPAGPNAPAPPAAGAKPAPAAPGQPPAKPTAPPAPGAKPAPTAPGAPAKPGPFAKKPAPANPNDPNAPTPPDQTPGQDEPNPRAKAKPSAGMQPSDAPTTTPDAQPSDSPTQPNKPRPGAAVTSPGSTVQPDQPDKPKAGGGGRSGETDEDRQRMASKMPGRGHVEFNKNVKQKNPDEVNASIADISAQIEALKKELMGATGQPPDPNAGNIPNPTNPPPDDSAPDQGDKEPSDDTQDQTQGKPNPFVKKPPAAPADKTTPSAPGAKPAKPNPFVKKPAAPPAPAPSTPPGGKKKPPFPPKAK